MNCLIDLDNDSNNVAGGWLHITIIMFAATIIRLEFNCCGPEKGRLEVGGLVYPPNPYRVRP